METPLGQCLIADETGTLPPELLAEELITLNFDETRHLEEEFLEYDLLHPISEVVQCRND